MDFIHYNLGHVESGKIIEVSLGYAANVSIMDNSDFYRYKNGGQHSYYGGYVKRSPYCLTVPYGGYWHVAIDLGGYGGTVKSSVRVID